LREGGEDYLHQTGLSDAPNPRKRKGARDGGRRKVLVFGAGQRESEGECRLKPVASENRDPKEFVVPHLLLEKQKRSWSRIRGLKPDRGDAVDRMDRSSEGGGEGGGWGCAKMAVKGLATTKSGGIRKKKSRPPDPRKLEKRMNATNLEKAGKMNKERPYVL